MFTLAKAEPIELTSEWLKINDENIEFSLVFLNKACTAVLKDDYLIEPLQMERIDGNFNFTAIVQNFEARLKALERLYPQLEKRVEEYETNGIELISED